MKLLPEQIDLFTLTGGIIAAISSLFAILVAVSEATKPKRIDNQLNRIRDIIASEEHPGRLQTLKSRKLDLEASLYARESLSGAYLLWGIAGIVFPIARFAATTVEPHSLTVKIIIAILMVMMCFLLAENILDTILRRQAIIVRYIAGKNPAENLNGLKAFAVLRSGPGLALCLAWTATLSYIVLYLVFSKWNGHSMQSTAITLFLFVAAMATQSQPTVINTRNTIQEIAIKKGALE
ncbi:hypothetical protein [Corynebacterium ulcerans]|uniref:hypothetical protein n=1 Tax=Corynebacterium ulcerans TaxID=65058 RepID=UPI00051F7EDD|nr:hypothetical protein [Corynebacterium ulcerans]AIT89305.1 Hypothetical protein Cul210932_1359 [Corynebacterium ulcerans]ALD95081.1 Hypothetical protein Cul131001_1377 [Corynebacterium ulcerans]SQG58928.1 Uncharacterised protein [Corynebacterium ulcerans]